MWYCQRLIEEVDEVVGDKEAFDAEDLENLKYMHQVCIRTIPAVYMDCIDMLLVCHSTCNCA